MRAERLAETVVACSTPPGRGAVAVVRISGPATRNILARILRSRGRPPWDLPRQMRLARVVGAEEDILDEALAVFFPGPASYTGEDMAEIHCHGSEVVVDTVVARILSIGARPAVRGEFTRRALEAGKFDLTRAEAIMRLVEAGTREQASGAMKALKGTFSGQLRKLEEGIQATLAHVEATIDFPEETETAALVIDSIPSLAEGARSLARALRRVVEPGTEVVFAGRPNVGKSSLVNAVVGRRVSIVCEEPGTTRDAVSAGMIMGGMRVTLVDTAGLAPGPAGAGRALAGRRADLEAARVSRDKIRDAGLVVWVTDRRDEPPPHQERGKAPVIWVVNKIDRIEQGEKERLLEEIRSGGGLPVSARTGEGLDAWERAAREALHHAYGPADGIPVTARQRHAVDCMIGAIERAESRVQEDRPELAAVDLREALEAIEELTGARIDDQVLDRIFEEFCIGK